MSIHNEAADYLDSLSTLARRGFNSNEAATEAILQLLVEQLAMRSSFLTHVTGKPGQLEVIATHNEAGGCDIDLGSIVPLCKSFQSILGPGEPSPVLLENLRSDQALSSYSAQCVLFFASVALSRVGSHIGVPVVLSDGTIFGTLCAVDPEARQLSLLQVKLLVVLARLLATQIERDQELAERKWAETELARALASLHTANEQREQMNKIQSDFVSIVNHEFRTALTGIQGFSELMRDEEFSFQEIQGFAADINADAQRLARMINQLLDLEMMGSGQKNIQLEQIDLNAIIKDVIDQICLSAPRHRFRLQLDNTLPLLSGDRDKLVQVITHLVENAVKYSAGGEILLGSTQTAGHAHVRVQDQGIGIPPDALKQVFDPYYSRIASESFPSPRQYSHYVKGTGLGLPIVRQIVQMHGGKAWAESVLGQGSTFHFTIPLVATS